MSWKIKKPSWNGCNSIDRLQRCTISLYLNKIFSFARSAAAIFSWTVRIRQLLRKEVAVGGHNASIFDKLRIRFPHETDSLSPKLSGTWCCKIQEQKQKKFPVVSNRMVAQHCTKKQRWHEALQWWQIKFHQFSDNSEKHDLSLSKKRVESFAKFSNYIQNKSNLSEKVKSARLCLEINADFCLKQQTSLFS